MKKLFYIYLTLTILCFPVLALTSQNQASDNLFPVIERIDLDFGDVVFSNVCDVQPIKDGFAAIIIESAFGELFSIVKFSHKGKFLCKYDRRGNGPGEIRQINNCVVKGNSILVSEITSPFIHEFNHNLEFIKDYRIKKGGKILFLNNHIGIWTLSSIKEKNTDKNYMLALYDCDTLQFKKYAFEIREIPSYVFNWGGITKVDEATYAGGYPTEYQIRILDSNFNFKRNLIRKVPQHIKKYHPWKKSPHSLDDEGFKWMRSWSKLHTLYYVNDIFIFYYLCGNVRYLDIFKKDGTPLLTEYKEDKNSGIIFIDGSYVWRLSWNDDSTKFSLIKTRLNL